MNKAIYDCGLNPIPYQLELNLNTESNKPGHVDILNLGKKPNGLIMPQGIDLRGIYRKENDMPYVSGSEANVLADGLKDIVASKASEAYRAQTTWANKYL